MQALSGIGESIQNRANILGNTALNAALNTQFLFQIGIFTAVPMILGIILEQGFLSVILFILVIRLLFNTRLNGDLNLLCLIIGCGELYDNADATLLCILHLFFRNQDPLLWSNHTSRGCKGNSYFIVVQILYKNVYDICLICFVEHLNSTVQLVEALLCATYSLLRTTGCTLEVIL